MRRYPVLTLSVALAALFLPLGACAPAAPDPAAAPTDAMVAELTPIRRRAKE